MQKSHTRLGLCCLFREEDITYRTTTVTSFSKLEKTDQLLKASEMVLHNLDALEKSIRYCYKNGVGCFRINSQFLPLYTHEQCGYTLENLPENETIFAKFEAAKKLAKAYKIRLVFHPDQFVVLNSPSEEVVANSIKELEYHGMMAELLDADVINIHGGGVYGDKKKALLSFAENFKRLSPAVTSRLTVENDDRSYTPEDLLPLCKELQIPLVYDAHHHRCLKDRYSIEEASKLAIATWNNREPLFHISSPINGWNGTAPRTHHDYIDPADFPQFWKELGPLTVEVEAKAKELAVKKLIEELALQ